MRRTLIFLILFSIAISLGIIAALHAQQALPRIETSTYTSAKVCAQCHEAIYSMWKNSLHAGSLADPIFDVAYMQALKLSGGKAKTFCLRCHAPTTRVTKDYDLTQELTKEGITCDFCHTIAGVDMRNDREPFKIKPGLVKRGPYRDVSSPAHQVAYSEVHTRSEICGGCHEIRGKNGISIMSTYSEWKAGPYAKEGKQCQDCHMPYTEALIVKPEVKGSRKRVNLHNIQGGHSIEQVKKAARVRLLEVKRAEDRALVRVEVANIGSGHMIPTGIPSRELVLTLVAKNAKKKVVHKEEMVFRRVLADEKGTELKTDAETLLKAARVLTDNRISPRETREVRFAFDVPRHEEVTIETTLTYRYPLFMITPQEMAIEMGMDSQVLR